MWCASGAKNEPKRSTMPRPPPAGELLDEPLTVDGRSASPAPGLPSSTLSSIHSFPRSGIRERDRLLDERADRRAYARRRAGWRVASRPQPRCSSVHAPGRRMSRMRGMCVARCRIASTPAVAAFTASASKRSTSTGSAPAARSSSAFASPRAHARARGGRPRRDGARPGGRARRSPGDEQRRGHREHLLNHAAPSPASRRPARCPWATRRARPWSTRSAIDVSRELARATPRRPGSSTAWIEHGTRYSRAGRAARTPAPDLGAPERRLTPSIASTTSSIVIVGRRAGPAGSHRAGPATDSRIPARDMACRCLARYAVGTPWNSASRPAGSAVPAGSTASSAAQWTPHSTPSESFITPDSNYPDRSYVKVATGWPDQHRRAAGSDPVEEQALERPGRAGRRSSTRALSATPDAAGRRVLTLSMPTHSPAGQAPQRDGEVRVDEGVPAVGEQGAHPVAEVGRGGDPLQRRRHPRRRRSGTTSRNHMPAGPAEPNDPCAIAQLERMPNPMSDGSPQPVPSRSSANGSISPDRAGHPRRAALGDRELERRIGAQPQRGRPGRPRSPSAMSRTPRATAPSGRAGSCGPARRVARAAPAGGARSSGGRRSSRGPGRDARPRARAAPPAHRRASRAVTTDRARARSGRRGRRRDGTPRREVRHASELRKPSRAKPSSALGTLATRRDPTFVGGGDGRLGHRAGERTELADLLDTLTPEQWDAPSLCTGWRVRDVTAHLVEGATMTKAR